MISRPLLVAALLLIVPLGDLFENRRLILTVMGLATLALIAAAITDAVHHATGVRVRELPVKIEDLLG